MTWLYALGAVGMAVGGMRAVVAFTPKRQPGRHVPKPVPLREEAGADVTYAAELHVMAVEIAEGGDLLLAEEVVEEEPAPVEEEPPAVEETPEPPFWMRTALADEPTPLAPGPVPALERWETFTEGWVRKPRAELLEELRSGEYELAKGEQAA